ncbi:hypothetical protein LIQ46_00245 [Megasphaera elsdenii]|uniref:hypothetical protein n=1 Tax=Megasphaera elsdenii TaxID=907 RepID=UPI001D02E976|nr:hypothetical protein [Megasphaera elsdenii]MCB5701427.1 hypothetical protein [Megasphaera elsdenii]MCB5726186.1 hypothetical protein [Megasphaera elsdenii]MCB5770091.1 hypothetical protein [Megasphaera elsdenii]
MKRQCYQVPEIRDENNNIIQEGTYGRTSPLVTIDNTGVLDYINNNLEALHDALLGDRVYVDNAKDLPNPGDASVTYITRDSGEVYYYDPTAATYTAINQGKEYAKQAEKSSAAAEASEINAANSESNALQYKDSALESKTASATSERNAAKSEVNAKQALVESQKIQKEVESALTKVTGFAKYAGSVDNYSDLPSSGMNTGDVWNIVNADTAYQIKAGDNVIWNGKAWDNLSGFVDLSNYPTNKDVAKAIVDTTYSGGTITFIHKDGTKSTATIGDTSHAIQADQDGKGNVIADTYYRATDAATIHQSFQNQINEKQDTLTFDSTPTTGSTNPVTSNGIYNSLQNLATKEYVDNSGTTIVGNIQPRPVPANAKYGNALIIFKDDLDVGVNSISSVIGPYVKNEIAASNSNIDLSEYAKKTDVPAITVSGNTISFGSVTIGVD